MHNANMLFLHSQQLQPSASSSCICRSSSEAVILFLHGQTFPGIFAASCLHTWRNCESLSWVMCVYPPQAPEVTPSRHRQGGQHLRVPISKVAMVGGWPHCLCCLSAIWPCSGCGGSDGDGGLGGFVGRTLQCFQKHRLLAAMLNMMEKNACC